tara:strand:- start:3778 stop:4719 length:942 start_codon:yes stop_codon:yes gene_type:complete
MSEQTQNLDAEATEPNYFDLGGEAPIQESDSGQEQEAPNPVNELESYDENLTPPTFQNLEETSEESAPKEDTSRFEYWQSKYDQKASDYNKLQEEMGQYEKVAPIANYIQENPDILKGVAKSLSGDTPSVADTNEQMASPKKPERPAKPVNYDSSEAYMDVDSASFKYRESVDKYRDEMIDYSEQAEQFRVREMEARENQIRQAQQQYEAQKQSDGMRNELMGKYGYTPDKAQQFMQYYSSPDSLTLDNLVRLDKMRSAPSQAEVEQRQKAEMMKQKQNTLNTPPPAGVVSAQSEPQINEEDAFNLGLMRNRR